ncbi:hypothetical protein KEM52_004820 [Ascosphaera acerosa]|nr:hypothetical protein KEM52_004820 [Ascosphaera acerosa]
MTSTLVALASGQAVEVRHRDGVPVPVAPARLDLPRSPSVASLCEQIRLQHASASLAAQQPSDSDDVSWLRLQYSNADAAGEGSHLLAGERSSSSSSHREYVSNAVEVHGESAKKSYEVFITCVSVRLKNFAKKNLTFEKVRSTCRFRCRGKSKKQQPLAASKPECTETETEPGGFGTLSYAMTPPAGPASPAPSLLYSPSMYSRPVTLGSLAAAHQSRVSLALSSIGSSGVGGGGGGGSTYPPPPSTPSLVDILDMYATMSDSDSEHDPTASPCSFAGEEFGTLVNNGSGDAVDREWFAQRIAHALQTHLRFGPTCSHMCSTCREWSDVRLMPARFSYLHRRGLQDWVEEPFAPSPPSDSLLSAVDVEPSFYPGQGRPMYLHNAQVQLSTILEASSSEEQLDARETYEKKTALVRSLASSCRRKHSRLRHPRFMPALPGPGSQVFDSPVPAFSTGDNGRVTDEELLVDEFHRMGDEQFERMRVRARATVPLLDDDGNLVGGFGSSSSSEDELELASLGSLPWLWRTRDEVVSSTCGSEVAEWGSQSDSNYSGTRRSAASIAVVDEEGEASQQSSEESVPVPVGVNVPVTVSPAVPASATTTGKGKEREVSEGPPPPASTPQGHEKEARDTVGKKSKKTREKERKVPPAHAPAPAPPGKMAQRFRAMVDDLRHDPRFILIGGAISVSELIFSTQGEL